MPPLPGTCGRGADAPLLPRLAALLLLQAEAERQKKAAVPGLLNPYDNDDMGGGSDD